jgi:hypothetical protein
MKNKLKHLSSNHYCFIPWIYDIYAWDVQCIWVNYSPKQSFKWIADRIDWFLHKLSVIVGLARFYLDISAAQFEYIQHVR